MSEYKPKIFDTALLIFKETSYQGRYQDNDFNFDLVKRELSLLQKKFPVSYVKFVARCAPYMEEFGFTFPWDEDVTEYSDSNLNQHCIWSSEAGYGVFLDLDSHYVEDDCGKTFKSFSGFLNDFLIHVLRSRLTGLKEAEERYVNLLEKLPQCNKA